VAEKVRGPGGVTIRRSLVRNLVLLIVATAVAILALTVVQSTQAVEELSRTLVRRSAAQVETELDGFFDPVRRQLRMMSDWGGAGLLTPIEPPRLTPMLMPILRRQPQVSSLMVADDTGHGYMLLEQRDGYRRRVVWADRWGGTARWARLGRRGALERRWEEELGYDPRTRPWFGGAVEAGGRIAWTEPYTFFTTRDPGITASVTFDPPGEEGEHVVGQDVLLSDISVFTTQLGVSEHGSALVLADDGRVVGLPRDPRFEDADERKSSVLEPVGELGLSAAAQAHAEWREAGGGDRVFAVSADGERWWVGMRRFSLSPERSFWIQVLVPERDFLERVERQRNVIIGVVFLALVLAVAMALWLARAYSRPLEDLAAKAERIRTLDLGAHDTVESRLKEVRQLASSQERMRAALESFSRYVPIEVVRELMRRGEVAKLGGRTAELSVMFTDIEGFTTESEKMSPDAITAHMGTYFDAMLGILDEEHATVDKLIGDAIMAFWGAPVADPEHARHALEAVLRCRARLAELQEQWREEGLPTLPTRFGLHTGKVVVGNVGSKARLSYTVLGDTVNLAARLEGANKRYGTRVLATRAFKDAVGEGYVWRLVDRVAVKGRRAAVEVYEPLGREGEVDETRLTFARSYEAAFERYRERDFAGALEILAELDDADVSVRRLRELCERLRDEPPEDDWDATTRLSSK
jgi:adenylate cyclase